MAEKKKQYVAKRGITFEGMKGKPQVKSGDPLPEGVDAKTIADLLAHGDIEEASE